MTEITPAAAARHDIALGIPAGDDVSAAAREQAWNSQQLEGAVSVPAFRVWTYSAPAIVLGCSQHLQSGAMQQGLGGRVEVLVRDSGGGVVLAGPWLVGVSVVLPPGHAWLAGGLLESYRHLGQLHVAALAAFGIPASTVSPQELTGAQLAIGVSPVDWACFGSLSPWEVVSAQGRKLVGLAQRRRQTGVLLVAGTLTARPDWQLLCDAMGQALDAPKLHHRTVSCAQLAPRRVSAQQFAEALRQGLRRSLA